MFIFLFNLVNRDVKKFLKTNPFIELPPKKDVTSYSYTYDLEEGELTGTDLDHAYWRIAFAKGYISKKTYNYGLDDMAKPLRLATLSILGREKVFEKWENKIADEFTPYKSDEYKFYVNLYLENQYINDIQTEHYIDNGCLCVYCTKNRKYIFNCAKNGETQFEKIIHHEVVNKEMVQKFFKVQNTLKKISNSNNSKKNSKYGINFGKITSK